MKPKKLVLIVAGLTLLFSAGCARQPSVSEAAPSQPERVQPRSLEHPTRVADVERYDYTRRPAVRGRSKVHSAEIIAGTAGVGAVIGALAGGGKGAAIGAIAGGGGGLIYDRATAHKVSR